VLKKKALVGSSCGSFFMFFCQVLHGAFLPVSRAADYYCVTFEKFLMEILKLVVKYGQ
jgi:hypothetical protein